MTDELNIKISVGTDVASWFLFHPDDLAYRRHDPHTWWTEDFAIAKEFAAGRLIAVGTGKDGNTNVRFTNQGLTEREQTYARKSAEFRLRVQQGCLYLDGGWAVPSAEQIDPEECYRTSYGWLTLPNGDYRATVHALAWFEEPGSMNEQGYSTPQALATFVVDIQPVKNLEEISPLTSIPDLEPIIYSEEWLNPVEEIIIPLEREYPLLCWDKVIFLGIEQELDLSTITEPFELMDRQVVVSYSQEDQAITTLFKVGAIQGKDADFLIGVGEQLVRLNRIFKRRDAWWVEVEPYEPPSTCVDSATSERLKQLFADYAAKDTSYQSRIKFHRFYAERVASLKKPKELGWFVAQAIPFSGMQQQALLSLSDADLIEELNRVLEVRLSEC